MSTRAEVDSYTTGEVAMPLSRQRVLAQLVIEQSPRFARKGYALREQVVAAHAFEHRHTKRHGEPPGRWTNPHRRRPK